MRFLGLRRLHFVGAGGVGMSGIAEILSRPTPLGLGLRPRALGEHGPPRAARGEIHVGHDPAHVDRSDLLVISSAVAESNAEVAAAR